MERKQTSGSWGLGGGEIESSCLIGTGLPFGVMKMSLEHERGDGCTT